MFNKKEIEDVNNKLELLNKSIEVINENISDVKLLNVDNSKKILDKINEINSRHVNYFEEFDKNISAFNSLNLMYRKEFDNLGSFKSQLAEKLLDKLSRDIKDEVQKHFAKLESEKKNFELLSKELESLMREIQKLKAVSETVKTMDFELTNYSKKLLDNDTEKLRLMNKIDNLEKLISKMRQGRHA